MSWKVMVEEESGIYGFGIDSWPGRVDFWCTEGGVEERVYIQFTIDQANQLIEAIQEAVAVAQELEAE